MAFSEEDYPEPTFVQVPIVLPTKDEILAKITDEILYNTVSDLVRKQVALLVNDAVGGINVQPMVEKAFSDWLSKTNSVGVTNAEGILSRFDHFLRERTVHKDFQRQDWLMMSILHAFPDVREKFTEAALAAQKRYNEGRE